MDAVMRFFRRLGMLLGRERCARELEEEMALHRDQVEKQLVEDGMAADEARYAAMRQFGNATRMKEQSHEVVRFRMETVMQDLRFALRQLRKNPGFAVTAILILALGIGASVAIFAFVDAALIQPLPYWEPSRLVALFEAIPMGPRFHLSYLDYLDWKRQNTVFSSLDVFAPYGFLLQTPTGTVNADGASVSVGFFRTLSVTPVLGRDFRPGDDQVNAPRTVLLSYAAWQRRYGARRDVLGQTVTLDGRPNTIIGVLPANFQFAPAEPADFWATERADGGCEKGRGCHNLFGVARLKPGVTFGAAYADIKTIADNLERQYPDSNRDQHAYMLTLNEDILGNIRPILLVLLTGAGLLLLIAAVNVSSLLLVRSERRKREMAVRGALGASRARLLRLFVVEGMVLSVTAAALGVGAAWLAMRSLPHLLPDDILAKMPYLERAGLGGRVVGFAAAVSICVAILFSILPSLRVTLSDLREGLTEGARGSSGVVWRRFGSNLVAVELTMAVVLLVGAGLLGKSFYRLLHVDTGIEPQHLATLHLAAYGLAYAKAPQQIALERELQRRLGSLPGVMSVAVTTRLPLGDGDGTTTFNIAGRAPDTVHREVAYRDVSANYFSTMQARLVSGRYFREDEDESKARVVIINQQMARQYFAGENPIGMQIALQEKGPQSHVEIVGVIDDIQEGQLDAAPRGAMYIPFNQGPDNYFSVVMRTEQRADAVLPAAVAAVHEIDPGIAMDQPMTMAERIHDSPAASMHRSSAFLVGGFAGLALLLSVVGLYGVVAYSVSQRTREIGVRIALGAQRSAVHGMILREAGRLAGIGIVVGLGCSIGAARLMGSLLFEVRVWDVPTLAVVAAVLGFFALLASYLPARRAARVNPVDALRAE